MKPVLSALATCLLACLSALAAASQESAPAAALPGSIANAGPAAQEALGRARSRRDAALAAEAPRLASRDWIRAEELLSQATGRLEAAEEDGAVRAASEAAKLYDGAERQALEALLLTEARRAVMSLGGSGAARLAPKTAARAEALLQQAEAELEADRSQREAVARLAAEAVSEARHAVALAGLLGDARKNAATQEDLLLEWEQALAASARAAGVEVGFEAGPYAASAALAEAIAALRAGTERREQELRERDQHILALEEEIRELDSRLAGLSREAQDANLRLAEQARAREQLKRLEALFTPADAVVLRRGDELTLRLHGLAFASSSARLEAGATALLERVGAALALYPNARVAVEGHTDSSGDSVANQRLSQQRAETVRDHLAAQAGNAASGMTAIGYGDTRPIASNEDAAGRRENRRIDLVITPPPGTLP